MAATTLAAVPAATRRRLAGVLLAFGALFLVIGVLAVAVPGTTGAVVLGVLLLAFAAVVLLVGWGLRRSITLDAAPTVAATRPAACAGCTCGATHDMAALDVR